MSLFGAIVPGGMSPMILRPFSRPERRAVTEPSPEDSPDVAADRRVEVVADGDHGMRLRDFLQRRLPRVDRVALRRLVLEGCVSVNGEDAALNRRVYRGDVVYLDAPEPVETLPHFAPTTGEPEVRTLWEDEELLVVDKPSGLPCTTGRSGSGGVLESLSAARSGADLHLWRRLAKDTSGCLVLTKSAAATRRLEASFSVGDTAVECLALVNGAVRWQEKQLSVSLGPDRRLPGRVCVVSETEKGARATASRFVRVEQFRRHSVVRAVPQTWRNHQIRVHLRYLGHPVVADPDYSAAPELLLSEIKVGYKSRPGVAERPLLRRMFVHFDRLRLPDRVVTAPLPADLELVLGKMRRFAAVSGHRPARTEET